MKRVLLHVCCAPCATHPIELLSDGYAVTLFFSNSNIFPEGEYRKRMAGVERLATMLHIPLIEDAYDHGAWTDSVRGYEAECERGVRCELCFAHSLGRAAKFAAAQGFDGFTTTLTISPHKDTAQIFRTGGRLGGFIAMDFKQGHGFQRSIALSRRYGLDRQSYCGCEFSMGGKG